MSIPRILLEDRAEITELIAEYAYRYDENRITDFVELFLADAELSFYVASGDEPFLTTSSNAERMVTLREIKSSPNRQAGQAGISRPIPCSRICRMVGSVAAPCWYVHCSLLMDRQTKSSSRVSIGTSFSELTQDGDSPFARPTWIFQIWSES